MPGSLASEAVYESNMFVSHEQAPVCSIQIPCFSPPMSTIMAVSIKSSHLFLVKGLKSSLGAFNLVGSSAN